MEGMLSSPAFGAGSAPDSVCWWIQPPPAAGPGWCLAFLAPSCFCPGSGRIPGVLVLAPAWGTGSGEAVARLGLVLWGCAPARERGGIWNKGCDS